MPDELAVWLYGTNVGTLAEERRVLSFRFSEEAYRRWGLRSPILSLSMPVSTRPYRDAVASPFFEGLVPEGQLRKTLAYDFRIAETDTFGLLRRIGRDCAGAVVVRTGIDGAPSSSDVHGAEPIGSDEVAARIANLPSYPLGVDKKVRVSLAGVQNKLLLTKTAKGWALPVGAPSTHILKPAISRLPESVENEDYCMRLARHVGVRAAATEIERFGGSPVLVVERFDRAVDPDGTVRRVHQEDVDQALGIEPARKYEASGGPPLRRVASLLSDWRAPREELSELLRQVTFVVAVGDADHHAKNISILHGEDGGIRLTPLYDVMCTRYYPSVTTAPGMYVNGKRHIDEIRPDDLVEEGTAWGLPREDAEAAVREIFVALPEALEATAASQSSPTRLVRFLEARARALHDEAERESTHARLPALPASGSSPARSASADRVWVEPYRRDDGTPVRGHWRKLRRSDARRSGRQARRRRPDP